MLVICYKGTCVMLLDATTAFWYSHEDALIVLDNDDYVCPCKYLHGSPTAIGVYMLILVNKLLVILLKYCHNGSYCYIQIWMSLYATGCLYLPLCLLVITWIGDRTLEICIDVPT